MASVQKLLLEKIQSMDSKLDKVRTEDLPALHTAMALQKAELEAQNKRLEEKTSRRLTWYTVVSGALAAAVMLLK